MLIITGFLFYRCEEITAYGTGTEPGEVDTNLKSEAILAHWRVLLLSVPDVHADCIKTFQVEG